MWHLSLSLPWWRHQMETFSALLAICAGNSSVPGEFPTQRPVTRSFDIFFDLRPNKQLSKRSWGWWFETLSWSLWRHCNVNLHHTSARVLFQYMTDNLDRRVSLRPHHRSLDLKIKFHWGISGRYNTKPYTQGAVSCFGLYRTIIFLMIP